MVDITRIELVPPASQTDVLSVTPNIHSEQFSLLLRRERKEVNMKTKHGGRGAGTQTLGLLNPNQALYQTELHPEISLFCYLRHPCLRGIVAASILHVRITGLSTLRITMATNQQFTHRNHKTANC